MIQDVEEFCPELHIECLGDFGNVSVFEDREIPRKEPGSIQTVTPRVTQQIRTGPRLSREGDALRGDIRGRLRQSETVRVEVVNASVDGITPGDQVRDVHGEVAVEPRTKWIAASAQCG